ncbi:MAG: CBS domain-containing protein [Rhodocyclaceae bacterium]|nr:CBS domain-containing protein [Rhodocyclaceae bacterium]MDP3031314.1 CBS domain-containing protein [Rhodocyclaceae bacterium]
MSLTGTTRELLIPLADFPHVRSDLSLRDVFAKMHALSGTAELFRNVLVVDDKDRLIGILGLKNLLNALLPEYLKTASHFEGAGEDLSSLAALWQDDCEEACRSAHKIIVKDHVTPVSATIKIDDPLTIAVFLFATTPANILPVMDNKRLVGVLRLVDLFDEVTSEVLCQQVTR